MEEELRKETLKWLERIEAEKSNIIAKKSNEDFMRNIEAYIADSRYFLNKSDLIRAFEAVVWAWAWLEIGLRLNVLSRK
ncbi:MAG TPA: DUF357 domain-containing protein [Archaeoglobaceae archaeon]|nr:DUF357 domain-containing protein [Archaeoglobaceae archaeon]